MAHRSPLIALISAVPASIPPVTAALQAHFPEATVWNILDDRLLEEAEDEGGLTPRLTARMRRLIDHAVTEGADGVLLTCSLYSPVARLGAQGTDVPVLGPDEAVFGAAAARDRDGAILVVSSAAGPLADSLRRIREELGEDRPVEGVVAEGAVGASRSGDIDALVTSIIDAMATTGTAWDSVVLGQYSLAPAAPTLEDRLGIPVLSGPRFAVEALRRAITGEVR
ncbi:hypothetical protein GCM10010988_21530 [Cnuibacter physcomitrellae]|uniref:Uncharacterized protein n=1 Tax=Cnuibacter physcomitrellae TaxID=1619308 RepID=A0A1X9LNY4_9MICO|nr:aspartate/glutamate racemase family protein [Cnuibacter physcomitrellae]ARJ06827.1 hypothetical protein B5808_17570 [Cnuibacter physcomitrellae]GGI38930.1 hypothetical protein GCM10010988_21530 [Cnuibacter physcomitrellae]